MIVLTNAIPVPVQFFKIERTKPVLKMDPSAVKQGFALNSFLFQSIGIILAGCIEGMLTKYVEREVIL